MKKIMVLLLATSMLFASVAYSNGNGGSKGSVVTKDDYLGTWTGPIEGIVLSITLNADGSCVAYNSSQGFFAGENSNWTFTNPGVTVIIEGEDAVPGRLENGKLVVNFEGDIPLTKVDTSAYVGTWIGTMGDDMSLSVTLNADGTVFAKNSSEEETTGLWTVTNSYFTMWLDVGDEDLEEGFFGNLQNGKLVVNYAGKDISLTKE